MLLLADVSSSAMAEWVQVGVVDDGSITFYANPSTIRKDGELVKMREMQNYLTPKGGQNFLSVKGRYEYDCKNENARTLFVSLYSGNMDSGDVVEMKSFHDEWTLVVPDTMFETNWKYACGKK